MTLAEACTLLAEVTADLGKANDAIAFLDVMTQRMAARLHTVAAERNQFKRRYYRLLDATRTERRAA